MPTKINKKVSCKSMTLNTHLEKSIRKSTRSQEIIKSMCKKIKLTEWESLQEDLFDRWCQHRKYTYQIVKFEGIDILTIIINSYSTLSVVSHLGKKDLILRCWNLLRKLNV